jgi:hypothetical protein
MRILLHDIIQESDAPEQLKSPSLSDVYEYTEPLMIKLDKTFRVNAIGIANSKNATSITFSPSFYWNKIANQPSINPRCIAYGDGRFVLLSYYSSTIAAYSDDGINWTETTLPDSYNIECVTYGNGMFVALSVANKAIYSADGINWTETTFLGDGNWRDIAFGNGRFVAISYHSTIAAYSDDGINWTETTLPNSYGWTHIAYGDGRFVVISYEDYGRIAYSDDGINWTILIITPGIHSLNDIAFGNGRFVVVDYNKIIYSDDGTGWTETEIPGGYRWDYITYGGDGMFIMIARGAPGRTAYSEDGINWTVTETPGGYGWTDIACGDGTCIAISDDGFSTNKISWTKSTSYTNVDIEGDGLFFFDEIYADRFELQTDGNSIGRLAMGLGIEIRTAVAKEPAWKSTASPRVTLSGQVIEGRGGYVYRTLSLDSRYRIPQEAIEELQAGYKYIGMGYPFFIDLTKESYKLPYSFLYAEEDNQRNMSFEGGIKKYLYSRRWNFTERF